MPKVKLNINVYRVVSRAVEEGVDYGWMRAHKHTDKPDEETIKSQMYDGVTNALCEVIKFD